MDINKLNEIRRLAIVALFSDDDLMNVFVLKCGNAINLSYELDYRPLQDIGVSAHPNSLIYYIEFKKKWKVSIQALLYRSQSLGQITQNQYQYLMKVTQK